MARLFPSYIYTCFRYTHSVLHDAVFDIELRLKLETGSRIAELAISGGDSDCFS